MKVVILYRPESEHARAVETFIHDFKARYRSVRVDVLNVDSREGIALLSLYDIMRYPAILATANDGILLKHWEGAELPLMDEVVSHTHAGR